MAIEMVWHVHHDKLVEPCYDFEGRQAYIRAHKPSTEIETRVRLMKRVQGKLPDAVVKAWAALDKAWAALDKAVRDHLAKIEAFHAIECPNCPWDGETIFPKEQGDETDTKAS
jgi:hypothetical protein